MKFRSVLLISLVMLAACASPVKTRYHMLSGESPATAKAVGETPEYRVAIGPATIPEALDRQQIVLSIAPNPYVISDNERWSEPLKREIPRVIAEAVGQRLPRAQVAAHVQYSGQGADYQVLIDVIRFESVPGKSITLEATWSVRNRAGERVSEARSVFVEQVDAPGISPLVTAHAKALDNLGQEIAASLDSLY
ncbi:MAG: PqiC family protein [Pseudomonadota bacterium]